ncbi:MAG: YicC/YloC family endoribonuclease [Methylocystaceae bacterium]
MVMSMTGYGKGECLDQGYSITVELKGVNHRYFDMGFRTARRYQGLEDRVRDLVKGAVSRGRVEVSLNVEQTGEQTRDIKVDKDLAIAYYMSLKDLAATLNIAPDLSVIELFRLPDVFILDETEEDLEVIWSVVAPALVAAVDDFAQMRMREGYNLVADIRERDLYIRELVNAIEERSPQVVREHGERLKKRLADLLSDTALDENRLAQEVAILADKASITEEIVRLRSHSLQLQDLLNSEQPVGRKGDFLIQEMFREINTIGSKANDLKISQLTVEVKAELEKIREQIQNIE